MLGPVGFFIWASNYERPRPKAHTSTPLRFSMHSCATGQNQINGPTESWREVRAQGQKDGGRNGRLGFFKPGSPEEITGLFSWFRLTVVAALGSGGGLCEKAFAFNHDSHTWHQQTLLRSPANRDGEWQAGGGLGECSHALGHSLAHPQGNRTGMESPPLFWSIFSSLSFLGWPTEMNSLCSHSHTGNNSAPPW